MVKAIIRSLLQKQRRKKVKFCGKNVVICRNCTIQGNVYVGDNVVLGRNVTLVSTLAKIQINDNVIFGPGVTIYSGDHPIKVIGRHISSLNDNDKIKLNTDKDVLIESGCWIGANAIILKGVTVGRGSIIGAGAVVTRDVPAYSVYIGVPNVKVYERFDKNESDLHEKVLRSSGEFPNSFNGKAL